MATAVELAILLTAKDAASAALGKVGHELDGLGRTAGIAKGALLGLGAGIGIGVAAIVEFGKAAADEEQGMMRLRQAVENTGRSFDEMRGAGMNLGDQVEANIASFEKMTAFSDGEMRDALTTLVSQTGSLDEAMDRLPVAMDFARGAGIDLATASKLLGKVTDETTSVLARYGIRVEKNADATDVLRLVQERFAGQSEAFAKTATGQWQIFNNQIDNLKEDLGSALLPIATTVFGKLIEFIDAIRTNEGIQQFARQIGDTVAILGEMFGVITGSAPDAGAKLTDAVGPDRAKEIMHALAEVRETIKTVIGAIQDLVRWFQGSSKEAEFLRGTLNVLGTVIGWIAEHALKGLIDGIRTFLGLIGGALEKLGQFREMLGGLQIPETIGAGLDRIGSFLGGAIPQFQGGGVMPWTGLAKLEAGERVLPAGSASAGAGGVTIIVQGSLYGFGLQELARELGDVIMTDARLAGGRL